MGFLAAGDRSTFSHTMRRSKACALQLCPPDVPKLLCSVTLSLMRNFGLIGGTSRALGALSAALAKLTAGDSRSVEQRQ